MGVQARKNRAIKVTRKQPKNINLRIRNKISHSDIKAQYDSTISPAENFRNMGLNADVNKDVRRRNSLSADLLEKRPCAAFVGVASIAQVTQMSGSNYTEANPKRRKMSEFDQGYARKLIVKYKDDYKAMERDIQLNFYQHSEGKMKKMCEKFISLSDDELLVPKI